ncbi:MAG: peptidoglycan bridge formation glycyltransferase FemA/FemB family protein [Anaerolineaceae bacterium]|nr:peptidoglycan bridge formation glycyltransferase FemA/FemB family protein [Anaerolineaceae bacterium]
MITDWDETFFINPGSHIFQTKEWAEIKSNYGWQPTRLAIPFGNNGHANAMILERSQQLLPLLSPARVLYIPRGPIVDWEQLDELPRLLETLERLALDRKAIFIKIDPEIVLGYGIPGEPGESNSSTAAKITELLKSRGWRFSKDQIQFQNTVWIDLVDDENFILAKMKQKTRYNIKLCQKKGVVIRRGGTRDLDRLFQLYAHTSLRDGFAIRERKYYLDVWMKFMNADMAIPLVAEYEGEILAGLFLFHLGKRSWYLYGMSSDEHRELMPNYGLQWEAIRLSKELGCEKYDLWGAPDIFDGNDRMAGVFRFKTGLGGEVVRLIGAWDYPARKLEYSLYSRVLPKFLEIMRRRGRRSTIQEAGG